MNVREGAVLVLLGACSTSPAPTGAASPPALSTPTSAAAKVVSGDPAMPQLLSDLITLLSREVTLEDVAAYLGPVAREPGAPAAGKLTPRDPALRTAEIDRYPDDGKPYTVELELASPMPVAVLAQAFGAYRQGRTDRGQPREIWFPPAGAGPWKIVLIAKLPPGTSPIAESAASTLVLRRDPP